MGKERADFYSKLPKHITRMPVREIKIGKRMVGEGHPAFIIAEVSANHGGTIEKALKMIDYAADAGADAVKFQHYRPEKVAADTFVDEKWYGKQIGRLSDHYRPGVLPYEWTGKLSARAKQKGIIFMSTPFDEEAVDLLEKHGAQVYKVASYELTDDPLLEYIAKKGKPMIVSTGMATMEEVARAVDVINRVGNDQVVIMHCVSIYPAQFGDLNLRAITSMKEALKVPIGFSDHSSTKTSVAAIVAVTLGAVAIEKHFTASRDGGSVDDPHSMQPEELKKLVEEIRYAEQALSGSGIKQPVSRPPPGRGDEVYDIWARRSLYASQNIKAGTVVTEKMISVLRPHGGILPQHMSLVVGHKIVKNIKAREPLTWDHFLT